MPTIKTTSGSLINYSIRGSGSWPILLLAPGGMRSSIGMWANQPYDAWQRLPAASKRFRVIAMDQRNAGSSQGPLGDGWSSYYEDQIALLDALGIGKCLLVGSCIGPSFQFRLMREQPERFPAAVMMQPIGLAQHTTEPCEPWTAFNTDATSHWYGAWAQEMERSKRFGASELRSLRAALFGGEHSDFVFSVKRSDVAATAQSLLVFMGRDVFHPSDIAREIARVAPNAALVEKWRDEEYTPAVDARIEDFLVEQASRSLDG